MAGGGCFLPRDGRGGRVERVFNDELQLLVVHRGEAGEGRHTDEPLHSLAHQLHPRVGSAAFNPKKEFTGDRSGQPSIGGNRRAFQDVNEFVFTQLL
ncbi:hypothetical protein DQP58_16290 [Mycobacterium colombiense]|uniref:Uncharacterized protein n=1 Tax=Mycobacterium colombiense TaxID=339268 RepID=A0A329KEH7_9MYCO|nr:hypothetical protein DQP58_16290 [Mycobacterium colombiense]